LHHRLDLDFPQPQNREELQPRSSTTDGSGIATFLIIALFVLALVLAAKY
jgi:hypothetical protein